MEYKIIAQIVEVSATTLKTYVADFLPATGNSTENRPRGTATLMALHFRIHIYTHTYNSQHVTVGVGNYLLKLSNMSKFAGTAISRNRLLNFLIHIHSSLCTSY